MDNVPLVCCRRAVEDIEFDLEPVVDGLVECMVLGAKSFGVDAFFESFSFGSGTVLVLFMTGRLAKRSARERGRGREWVSIMKENAVPNHK